MWVQATHCMPAQSLQLSRATTASVGTHIHTEGRAEIMSCPINLLKVMDVSIITLTYEAESSTLSRHQSLKKDCIKQH